jgi:hypothetical protein
MSDEENSGMSSKEPFGSSFCACCSALIWVGAVALLIGIVVVGVVVSFMLTSEG